MADSTSIEWCDSTFNPWIGCTKVSPACDDCYAARSTPARTLGVAWGPKAPRHRTSDSNWALPRRWNARAAEFLAKHGRRQRVFCASLADVFDNEVPVQWRISLMGLILETPNLDWLLLTKRIGNAAEMLETATRGYTAQREGWSDNVPPHVWIGATVCNQTEADRDIPKLLATPARVRFLSMEPLLGGVAIWPYLRPHCERHRGPLCDDGKCEVCESRGIWGISDEPLADHEKAPIRPGLDWVICGGESGPRARPMHPDWVRSLRDQCESAGVPFLFKQWGEWLPAKEERRITGKVLVLEGVAPFSSHPKWQGFEDGQQVAFVGKNAAGRGLDGRKHDGTPTAP